MTRIRKTAAFCLLVLALTGAQARGGVIYSAVYVPGTEDVPLMPGLAPATDDTLIFDQPQGRIVEATASGSVRRRDVLAFYRASLPELGWTARGQRNFERAGEHLSLDFNGHDGRLTVDFMLVPG